MACYYPIDGWRAKTPNENGKFPIVFQRSQAQQDEPIKLPCSRCIGCRLERSRQWAMRCVHESTLYENNCFITLTYNNENLPSNGSLNKTDWQKFMKAFRNKIHPRKIRFFMGGEYGLNQDITNTNTLGRPHYHAIIFNYDFPDKELYSTKNDHKLYTSEILTKIWNKGFATVGAMSFETAGYVARYCMKKIGGDEAETHYQQVNQGTGEIINLLPEFGLQSNRPGIGRAWFLKYRKDLDKGFITMRGSKMKPPKYYMDQYQQLYEEDWQYLRDKNAQAIDIYNPDNTLDRLRVKEKIKIRRTKTLKREL